MLSYNTPLCTLFIDLHGVLVDSEKMIKNYEEVLVKTYNKIGIPREKAIQYHKTGLNLFLSQMQEAKKKNLIEGDFIDFMHYADQEWDSLMNSFVTNSKENLIESREIEFSAGSYTNCLYPDAITFLNDCIERKESIDFFICSNAHSMHIKGVLQGANFLNKINEEKILGYDKIKSLKSNSYYFKKLKRFSKSKINVLIGNSDIEILHATSIGFKTILLLREYEKHLKTQVEPDLKVPYLTNIFTNLHRLVSS